MRRLTLTIAILSIILATLVYSVKFFFILDYGVSNDTEKWAQFGDYFGGVLNPILSFIAIILLIESLNLQNDANTDLRKEIKNNEKLESIRAFSLLFFNIIDSQKNSLKEFEIKTPKTKRIKKGPSAIIYIEDEIEKLRNKGSSDKEIKSIIAEADHLDCIFSLVRSFYLAINLVESRLSDEYGFNKLDRENHYLTLINLTDFSQIRMILIGIQFIDCQYSNHIMNNKEFYSAMKKVNLKFNMY